MPLDPKAQEMLDASNKSTNPPVWTLPIDQARTVMYNRFVNPNRILEDMASIEDSFIPCLWGNMPIRIYRPSNIKKKGCLLFFHGGGFSLNCIETHESLCRILANKTERVVISVEYRLAPEHKFPALIEDAIDAAQWVYDNSGSLGIDNKRIAVCGDSGGALQSTVVCLYFRNRGGIKLEKQVLVYPPTDYYFPGTKSLVDNDKFSLVNRDFGIWAWNNYIDMPIDLDNQYLCPLRGKDFSNLPPALVITAEYDPLRDEGEQYAEKMKRDGTSVKLTRYNGMMHGFLMMSHVFQQAKDALNEIAEFLD